LTIKERVKQKKEKYDLNKVNLKHNMSEKTKLIVMHHRPRYMTAKKLMNILLANSHNR